MPSIIDKVKNALHSDTPDSHFNRPSSEVPGSFPDERREHGTDQYSSKHRDGRDYIAPSGTQVGGHGAGRMSGDHGDRTMTGGRSAAPQVDDRYLMDPADPRPGSNVMNTTGAGGNPETRLSEAGLSSGSQTNKLHKRDDPRGYEQGSGYPETGQLGSRDYAGTGTGTGGHGRDDLQSGSLRRQEGHDNLLDKDRPGHHHGVGTAAGVGAAGVGAGALASQAIPERTRHSHEQQSTQDNSRTSHISGSRLSGEHTYGQGVYNTVTGHGSGEDRLDDRRHAAPGQTSHSTHGGTLAPTAAVAGAATAAGMHKGSGHHDYAEQGRNMPTSATNTSGSEGWPLGESGHGTDRKPVGHSVKTTTTTNTNTNTSTYPSTSTKYPDHTLDSRGPTSNVAGTTAPRLPEPSFDSRGPSSQVPSSTTSRLPEQSLDSRGPTSQVPGTATSRHPEQSLDSRGPTSQVSGTGTDRYSDQSYGSRGPTSQIPGTATDRYSDQSYDSRGPTTHAPGTTSSRHPEQSLDSRAPPTGTSGPGPTSSNIMSGGPPVGAGLGAATSGSGDHYGPGHPGSKVLHKCKNCGHDNDISHYFRQGVSYRLE